MSNPNRFLSNHLPKKSSFSTKNSFSFTLLSLTSKPTKGDCSRTTLLPQKHCKNQNQQKRMNQEIILMGFKEKHR
jgi:hypothetical protein